MSDASALESLPADIQQAALQTRGARDFMWHIDKARDAINALADAGIVVLGTDLRSDGNGPSPMGFATEVAWSSFAFDPALPQNEIEQARTAALAALDRPLLADLPGYDWIRVAW
jgi:hypothetical protein